MTSATPATIGIDFGTTNTVVSLTHGDGPATLVRFQAEEKDLFAFRSALSFQLHEARDRLRGRIEDGNRAESTGPAVPFERSPWLECDEF